MTISSPYQIDQYAGNDVTMSFDVHFPFFGEDEIEVILTDDATGVETTQVLNTDYSVTGGGVDIPAEGSITFLLTAPATGETLTIRRATDRLQELDLTRGGPLSPNSVEGALDRAIMLEQEEFEKSDRALRYPPGGDPSLSAELPSEVDRANTTLGFDVDGEPICITGAVDTNLVAVTAVGETLIEKMTIAEMLDYLLTGVMASRGDLIVGDASGDASQLSIGPLDTVLVSDGVDPVWADPPWPPFFIQGFAQDGPTGTTWEMNIGVGAARCHTTPGTTLNTRNGSSSVAWTKKLNGSNWVAGTGNDGLANGATAKAADNWYAVFLMAKSTALDIDFGFDSSSIATNLKADSAVVAAGFDRFRFIGWVQVSSGGGDIDPFRYDPDSGLWLYTNVRSVSMSGVGNQSLTYDLPEGDMRVIAGINTQKTTTANGGVMLRYPGSGNDADGTNIDQFCHWIVSDVYSGNASGESAVGPIDSNSSKQLQFRQAVTLANAEASLWGFYVKRSDR